MKYKTVKEMSSIWNVKPTIITYLCRNNKIPGVIKLGKTWQIPENASMPKDGRHLEVSSSKVLLPLPIGLSSYKEAVSNYYYVDKTLLIKDIIDNQPKVSLFTRPRRFGKTLTMDMIKVFFEKTDEDTSIYFKDKKIWECGKRYQDYQGKYPVIFLTFKDVKFDFFDEALDKIKSLIQDEYIRHYNLLKDTLNDIDLNFYQKNLDGNVSIVELTSSLSKLSKYLYEATKEKTIIIIDEYDTPISHGYIKGYYDNIISLMRNLFSGAFKDNPYLSFGFMTGILRVAKESIFSGMNNLIENSILSEQYSSYFGFTKPEIESMLSYYDKEDKFDEVCKWYDGYRFGSTEIFNPWSVLNYIRESCESMAFWQNTGSNDIIRKVISESTEEIKEQLHMLLEGKSIVTDVDTSVIYPEIKDNPQTIFSFLLIAGYLKIVEKIPIFSSNIFCRVAIPNREIQCIYEKEILFSLNNYSIQSTAVLIQQAILTRSTEQLKKHLQNFLTQSISIFDTDKEGFYHGLMLGLYAIMNNLYSIKSNRESGNGRFDIQMEPFDKNSAGILFELKVLKSPIKTDESYLKNELVKLSNVALNQIDEKHYEQEMRNNGIRKILKFGIAFYKKYAEISFKEENK